MKRILKILAIVVVLVLVGTYAIYALDYKGNYNVSVSFKMNVPEAGVATITDFSTSSTETEVLQFWEQFKGHGGGDASDRMYDIYVELNYSDKTETKIIYALAVPGASQAHDVTFSNVPLGQAAVRIFVVYVPFDTTIVTQRYSVVIG